MSSGGGDTGGGGSSSGSDAGGAAKGTGGGGSDSGGGAPITFDNMHPSGYGGYSDPMAGGGGGYSSPSAGTDAGSGGGTSDPFGSGGGGGGYSDPFSGSGNPGAPSLDSLIAGGNGGMNLADPGVVGGSSPAIHGGVFSTDTSSPGLAQSGGDSSLTAPATGGGASASAFAAPDAVAGSPQLSDFIKDPTGDAGAGGAGSGASGGAPVAASDPGQGVFDLMSGLPAAEQSVTDQWAANNASSVPSIGSDTTLPATASGSGSGGSSGSGSSGGSGSNPLGSMSFGSNPLGALAAGGGLLNNMINGNSSPAYSPQLNAAAGSAAATGAQQTAAGTALQQYISTGQLPQGYEDQVQQAAQAQKQTIISDYAKRNLPTDPTKNSMLAQELAQVDAKLPAMREQLAQQLAQAGTSMVNTGLQATGIQSNTYQTLANLQNSQNQQRAQAIANFAASLNGGVKPKAA